MNIVEKAYEMAKKAHAGQVDKAGVAYFRHPLAVSRNEILKTEEEKCVALLHDVLEDTEVTEEEIRKEFGDVIADGVVALTRGEKESYEDFILRAMKNPIARKVKMADLTHNMDLSRLPKVTEKDIMRLEKYRKAMEVLESRGRFF